MATGSSTSLPKSSKQIEAEQDVQDDRFEIGDDSDSEDDQDEGILANVSREPPPPYESKEDENEANSLDRSAQMGRADQGHVLDEAPDLPDETQNHDERPAREHTVCKGDTIRSLALKYNLDVSPFSYRPHPFDRTLTLVCLPMIAIRPDHSQQAASFGHAHVAQSAPDEKDRLALAAEA